MIVTVLINLKPGVLDPQGRAIENSLHGLGYDDVRGVTTGKQITLDIDADDANLAHDRAAEMCKKLLVNSVIEDYEILIDDEFWKKKK